MIRDPFTLLRPFKDVLTVAIFSKEDDVRSDGDAAKRLEIDETRTAGVHQIHGRDVIIVREPTVRTIKADGMMTDQKNLLLCTRWADCQNFAVYVPERKIIGVLHAGWKGLVAGAIPSFFETVKGEWGIDAADVYIAAGPSLCQKCADFTDPKTELPGIPSELIDGRCADLRGWADRQFFECGVTADHFERDPDCTRCSPEKFWTYRGGDREEVKSGRTNMLVIRINN